jgi:hypothetical protein
MKHLKKVKALRKPPLNKNVHEASDTSGPCKVVVATTLHTNVTIRYPQATASWVQGAEDTSSSDAMSGTTT